MIGNVFATIAIPWFVLQSTGSTIKTGITGFSMTIAAVLASFFGGTIIDRLGFKPTSIIADITSALAFSCIPLLYSLGRLEYWLLLILVFIGNLLDAPGTTAREALLPDLAAKAGLRLEQASALIQAVDRGARMLGAPLAGLLVTSLGTQNVIWIDALSFMLSALIVSLAIPNRKKPERGASNEKHYFSELKEGLNFIAGDKLLFSIILMVLVTNFIDAPLSGVIYPVFFQQFFGSALDLGFVLSASGAGALITALLFGAIGYKLPRRWLFFGGFFLISLRFFIFAQVPPVWVLILISLITGMASGPINPIISTISYERIPLEFRGRVLGTMTSISYIAMPLGTALAGFVLEAVDVRTVLILMGMIYCLTILAAFFSPSIRDMGISQNIEVQKG